MGPIVAPGHVIHGTETLSFIYQQVKFGLWKKKVLFPALSEAVVPTEPLVYLRFSGGSPGISWGTHMEVKAQGQTWVRFSLSKALVKEGVCLDFLMESSDYTLEMSHHELLGYSLSFPKVRGSCSNVGRPREAHPASPFSSARPSLAHSSLMSRRRVFLGGPLLRGAGVSDKVPSLRVCSGVPSPPLRPGFQNLSEREQ